MRRAHRFLILALILAGGLVAPSHLLAQREGVREPVPHQSLLSANPLILVAGWFNAEYEHKLTEAMTFGLGGGWLSLGGGDDDYANVNTFLRFYPEGAAFTGFYIGGRGGVYRVSRDGDDFTAFGLGVDLGYSWLLGPRRFFYVALGIGATRLFSGDLGGASATVPNLRLVSVGIAF
jgi:hypothetical protein